jgi:hypothetical protein
MIKIGITTAIETNPITAARKLARNRCKNFDLVAAEVI